VPSPVALTRHYIETHNRQNLDGLLAFVAEDVTFKRAGDRPLDGKSAVRRQYEQDWSSHKNVVVNIRQVFETGRNVAVEIHVHSGPPSNVHYDGIVVHHWNGEDQLTRYQLFVDEVTSAEGCS
jgi:ketosteroid isomerase-like protein